MTQISRRSLFGAAAAASVLPVAGGLAAFSPIAAAAAAPKKARTIVEIAAMSPVDMARESDVVQTSYEIIRAAAGRLRDPELRKAVLSVIENPAPTIASADQSAVLAALKKEGLIAAGRKEEALAGTGEHHVLSIAESIKRGLPAEFVVAQACAHEHPGSASGEAQIVGWLRAAAIIAGVDPVKAGLIAADGKTLPLPRRIEGWVVHLADHDWVISVPACQWVVKALRNLAEKKWGVRDEKTFNALRNYVLCNLTAMRLYGILSAQGEEAFAADVARVVKA